MITRWAFRLMVLVYAILFMVCGAFVAGAMYLLYWLIFVGIPRWMS